MAAWVIFLYSANCRDGEEEQAEMEGQRPKPLEGHPQVVDAGLCNPHAHGKADSSQTTSHPGLMPNTFSAIQVSLWREKGS